MCTAVIDLVIILVIDHSGNYGSRERKQLCKCKLHTLNAQNPSHKETRILLTRKEFQTIPDCSNDYYNCNYILYTQLMFTRDFYARKFYACVIIIVRT